jgi:predicted amidophosphoribosyltransferase
VRRALLELLIPSVCPACDRGRRPGEPLLCARCRPGLRPLDWLGSVATAIAYEASGAELVRRFKFDGRGDALEVLLAPLVGRAARLPDAALVPLPRHPARVRETGRDPVWRLGRALARASRRELWDGALRRTRPVEPQTGRSLAARRRNVAGSFRVARAVRGADVLLLDDVATSGATLAAASTALRAAGARRVWRLALAGTPPPVL